MKTFTDSKGREWAVAINLATATRIRDIGNVDLLRLDMGKLPELGELINDQYRMFDVLWACVYPQAQRLGVSKEEFGEELFGDHLFEATNAVLDELCRFTPDPKNRDLFIRAISISRQKSQQARESLTRALDQVEAGSQTAGNSSGEQPGVSE